MYIKIDEYMKLPKIERQQHLNLNESCIEIGGINSCEYRGLLAHFLKTEIPTRKKVYLCHACNNSKCSNVLHLYWGTPTENVSDCELIGRKKNPWDLIVLKHGLNEAKQLVSYAGKLGGISGGGSNKLSNEEVLKRQNVIKDFYPKRGWVSKSSKILDISHTQVKRFVKMYGMGS
jgi:late competence protein required for DNA uptake (superfamily II DNA/RNA helicase)